MKVLALLQCQWFKDPERARKLLEHYQQHEGGYWEGRARFIRDMLFMGCLTGKRILQAFGEELCSYDGMTFEETSIGLGGHSGASFEVDEDHVANALAYHAPAVLVAFGAKVFEAVRRPKVAAYLEAMSVKVLYAPHPASRKGNVLRALTVTAEALKRLLENHVPI